MPTVILATAGYDHSIRFWEVHSGICYRTIQYPESAINQLEISPDKSWIAAAGNPQMRLFEVAPNNNNPITTFDGHKSNVMSIGFQKNSQWMYSGSEDCTIKIWDIRSPGCQRSYECSAPVNSVVLHPNQTELICGDQNGNIRVWDLVANGCSKEMVPDSDVPIRSVSISSDGHLLAAANNSGKVFIWSLPESDTSKCEPKQRIAAHKTYILKTLFSPNGKLLATTSADSTVSLWDVSDSFAKKKTLEGHQRWVWDCAFSMDSSHLVTASSDQVARLWDTSGGEVVRSYSGHQKTVTSVALNDGPN